MNRATFEMKALALINSNPAGYEDMYWRIRYEEEDHEYYVRWSNGIMGRGHKEMVCYFKDGEFEYF